MMKCNRKTLLMSAAVCVVSAVTLAKADPDIETTRIETLQSRLQSMAIAKSEKEENLNELIDLLMGVESLDAKTSSAIMVARDAASRLGRDDDYIRLELLRNSAPVNSDNILNTMLGYIRTLQQKQQYRRASDLLRKYIQSEINNASATVLVQAVTQLKAIDADILRQYGAVEEVVDQVMASIDAGAIASQAALLQVKAELAIADERPDDAKTYNQMAFELLKDSNLLSASPHREWAMTYADFLVWEGETHQAVDVIMVLIEQIPASANWSAPVNKLLEISTNADELQDAAQLLREKIADAHHFEPSVSSFQPDIIRLVGASGDPRVIQEARVYLNLCGVNEIAGAIERVSWAFKVVDGNLSRANRFLEFHKQGHDIPNVLNEVAMARDEDVLKLFDRDISNKEEYSSSDWLRRAKVSLYLDDPVAAFDSYLNAFALSPLENTSLQGIVDALVRLIVVNTKDEQLAADLVEFLVDGESSEDNEAVLVIIRRRLAYP